MSKTYVIQWKSKVNRRAGKWTKLFDCEAAEALVFELNQEYLEINHEVLASDSAGRGPELSGRRWLNRRRRSSRGA